MQNVEEADSALGKEEEALDLEAEMDEESSGWNIMPWLIPVLMVVAFFAFVVVLVLFVL
ncbi:MAG TPA: hypothetical protein VF374_06735 [Thermoplasmata archaeon]